MRARKNMKSTVAALTSCGECSWRSAGIHQARVFNLTVPDTIASDEVLDLMLGPLQDNGEPTETHALLPGSPAIDRIPVADCQVTDDQRGEPRPVAILGPEPKCDVGAFERQPEDP